MEFLHDKLDNGLEIIAEANPLAYTTALAFFVKTGARNETDELSGVSHFLEHMVFKGTDRRTAEDVNRELDELGSMSNAYTAEEETVYHATVLPEYQDAMLELLADILRPALRPGDFDVEKKVVLDEIAKYDDLPPYGAIEKCTAAHFGAHPLGRNVLGTTATVGALTPEQMRQYLLQHYAPGNIVLVAAGRVDFPRFVSEARRLCGNWAPREVPPSTPPTRRFPGRQHIHKPLATQQYTVALSSFPSATDHDRFAARLLSTILGDESGSRLFWELVDTGRAEVASTGGVEFQDAGALMTFLSCLPEDTADILATVAEVVRELVTGGVDAAELERAQSKLCSHLVLQSERPSNRLFSVGHNWVQRREYRSVREAVQAYRQVTLDDLRRLLSRYDLLETTAVTIGPLQAHPWPT